MAKSYFTYWREAKNRHGVHSPFVFDLVENVFRKKRWAAKESIAQLRKELKRDDRTIEVNDLGAGSRIMSDSSRKVKEIAKISGATLDQARRLYLLAEKLEVKNVLELGTNLGLGAVAMASAPSVLKLISIEGDPSLAEIASQNLAKRALPAEVIVGSFEEKLGDVLSSMGQVDMAYIDGNHQEEATINYFDQISQHIHAQSVIIIGDIHWSEGMERAWERIKNKEGVQISIDLFDMGMVFFDPGFSKEHFTIKYK